MTKVEQIDWLKLKPATPERSQTRPQVHKDTKDKRKAYKNGYVKVTKLPKNIRQQHGRNISHIKSIMNEED